MTFGLETYTYDRRYIGPGIKGVKRMAVYWALVIWGWYLGTAFYPLFPTELSFCHAARINVRHILCPVADIISGALIYSTQCTQAALGTRKY